MTLVPRAPGAPPRLPEDWPDTCALCLSGSLAVAKAKADEIVSSTNGLLELVVCREGNGWHARIRKGFGR